MLHMNMALELDSTSLRINGNPKHGLAVDQLTPNREGLCCGLPCCVIEQDTLAHNCLIPMEHCRFADMIENLLTPSLTLDSNNQTNKQTDKQTKHLMGTQIFNHYFACWKNILFKLFVQGSAVAYRSMIGLRTKRSLGENPNG